MNDIKTHCYVSVPHHQPQDFLTRTHARCWLTRSQCCSTRAWSRPPPRGMRSTV
jgi:hypothetical protein